MAKYTKEQMEAKIRDTNNNTFGPIWQPTPILRWEIVNTSKTLQQLWTSNSGLTEWRDISEEWK